jgi:hypothetical protein
MGDAMALDEKGIIILTLKEVNDRQERGKEVWRERGRQRESLSFGYFALRTPTPKDTRSG